MQVDERPTIPNLLHSSATRFPERDYLVTADRSLTFAEVEAASRQFAKRLLHMGVGKGTRVGLLFPQGPDFVVAMLAVARIGALAVPLSTFFREPELRRAVRHSDVHLLLASPRSREVVEPLRGAGPFVPDLPYLRQIWIGSPLDTGDAPFAIADDVFRALESEVAPSDPMVIISTSGATAEPKAVVHTHGAQVRHSGTIAKVHSLDDQTRSFTTMPFFWVGGLTVILLSHLHVGAAVITVDRLDGPAMLDLIERARPTRLIGWTLVERLASDPALADRDLSWLADLQFPAAVPPGTRHSSLGMTETSGIHSGAVTAENVEDLPEAHRGSFGPPVRGMQHKIIDFETGAEQPEGIEGEICVRGVGLMDGLYKKERRETFDDDGWYHTGDRGFLRDGLLYFTGRRSEMIKTAGANVAPREVELALEALAGVQAAFVVGVPDGERGEAVGAMVCAEPGIDLDPESLAEQLRSQLSSYKVPKKMLIVAYDDAPWLGSGKVSKPRIVEMLLEEVQGGFGVVRK